MRPSVSVMVVLAAIAGCYGFVTGQQPTAHRDDWLSPPPNMISAKMEEDRRIYIETRHLQDSPRWQQAIRDAYLSDDETVQDFLVTSQLRLTDSSRRELEQRLGEAQEIAREAMAREKNIWKRRRPFIDYGGWTCVVNYKRFITSWSYPSGHAVRGYTIALILGGMFPDKKQKLLERAHDYAESRVICGMHWNSDIEAGEEFAQKLVDKIR